MLEHLKDLLYFTQVLVVHNDLVLSLIGLGDFFDLNKESAELRTAPEKLLQNVPTCTRLYQKRSFMPQALQFLNSQSNNLSDPSPSLAQSFPLGRRIVRKARWSKTSMNLAR